MLKILAFLLIVSISVETIGMLSKAELSAIFTEKTEKDSSDEAEKGKDDSKDKTFQYFSLVKFFNNTSSSFFLRDININLTAFLSLPERPPKFS